MRKESCLQQAITLHGEETFSVAGALYKATRLTAKVEIGGIRGLIAPFIGKQPADTYIWMVDEGAPAFVRADRALYVGGPIWRIEMTGPEWGRAARSGY